MKKKIIISSSVLVVAVVVGFIIFGGSKNNDQSQVQKVKVQRGTITERALAVGTIEPENEISIKSKVEGVVKRIFADAGTYVKAGQPLLEVKPDPTPLELAEAKRNLQLSQVEMDNVSKEKSRQESMVQKQLISHKDYEDFQRNYDQTQL